MIACTRESRHSWAAWYYMSMAGPLAIFWDHGQGGNVEHLAQHGVTPDEAEQVIGKYFDDREPSQSTPEYWVVR